MKIIPVNNSSAYYGPLNSDANKRVLFVPIMYVVLFFVFIFLPSCGVIESINRGTAERYYERHYDELAMRCENEFPPMDTTLGIEESITKGDNIDYSAKIAELNDEISWLRLAAENDNVFGAREWSLWSNEVIKLQNKIRELKASYKPCVPDTVTNYKVRYYKAPTDQAAAKKNVQLKERNDALTETNKNLIKWIVGLSVALIGGIIVSILKFMKIW